MAAKRMTALEKRRAAEAYRREATATLVLLTRLRGMIGDALARSSGTAPTAESRRDEAVWRQDFQIAFEELKARLTITREMPPTTAAARRRRASGKIPDMPSEAAREMMRGLHEAIQSDRDRPQEPPKEITPEHRKLLRVMQDFEDSYERATLCDKIGEQVAALMHEVEALRDLASGSALATMLGGHGPRGES